MQVCPSLPVLAGFPPVIPITVVGAGVIVVGAILFFGSSDNGSESIGVANIMYIVVQERVKETGIKRAVGAKNSNIHR